MKFVSIFVVGILGLGAAACDTVPYVANPKDPYTFQGDLNNLGGNVAPSPGDGVIATTPVPPPTPDQPSSPAPSPAAPPTTPAPLTAPLPQ